ILSEAAIINGALPDGVASGEMLRMLKPIKGVAMIGSPGKLTAGAVKAWLEDRKLPGAEVVTTGGAWAKIVRPAIPGSGAWTHQYGDLGNTGCSHDRALKAPLGVLWYGAPGERKMIDRHYMAQAPLTAGGVLVSPGKADVIEGYDAYTGRWLWRWQQKHAVKSKIGDKSSTIAVNSKYVFVATYQTCNQLDIRTGKLIEQIKMPLSGFWGWVGCDEDRLYGLQGNGRVGQQLFAVDIDSGRMLWKYRGASIVHDCVAIGDGSVFLIPGGVEAKHREQAYAELREYYKDQSQEQREELARSLPKRVIWLLVALDAKTGEPSWGRAIDVTNCGSRRPTVMYRNGVIVHCDFFWADKYYGHFWGGGLRWREISARSAEDGHLLWRRRIGFRARPLIIENAVHAEPWAYELKTGKQVMRTHPVTGKPNAFQYYRIGQHCGLVSASSYLLFFRSACLGYYDLLQDNGTINFSGKRPGCWVNVISGGGVMLMPPHSAGCWCRFPHNFSVCLRSVEASAPGGMFASGQEAMLPVKHLYLNLGAVGERRDSEGRLWVTNHWRFGKNLYLKFWAPPELYEGGGKLTRSSSYTRIEATDVPFVFATGIYGFKSITVPVGEKGATGEALYTVKLGFCDPHNDRPGRRTFDIKIGQETVRKGFDIVKETGGRDKPIFLEFKDIKAKEALYIELLGRGNSSRPDEMAILNAVQVLRQD
ncbi:MAG: malectin domain-containing carbohydrate-binding protein, partial [Planctomycetota bacterium]